MQKNKFKNWLKKKYQLVFRKKNYEIIWHINFNTWQIIIFCFLLLIINFAINYFLIGYTTIETTLPNFPDNKQKEMISENYRLSDSLLKEVEKRDKYLEMIRSFVLDDIPIDEEFIVSPNSLTEEEIQDFNDPTVAREEKHSQTITFKKDEIPKLFTPIQGIITKEFDKENEHYGIDIASPQQTIVKATLSGMVILTDFTLKYGYTIIIQHNSNLISVYKHCASIITQQGTYVDIGQAIAIYGSTGEESSGQHLHFELWKKGYPINPINYINF